MFRSLSAKNKPLHQYTIFYTHHTPLSLNFYFNNNIIKINYIIIEKKTQFVRVSV